MNGNAHPYFSIVVPCCEVGRYVDELVASIRGQSFADWECVLSVEISEDDTLEKCQAVARQDARFKVIAGPRSGSPATPRNRGMEIADGCYLIWLDGDDLLAEGVLARLFRAIQDYGEPEVVQGGTTEYCEDGLGKRSFVARRFNYRPTDVGRILTGEDAMVWFADSPRYVTPMASLSVCRADFLRANGLTFQPGLKYEDNEWTARLLTFAQRLLVVDFDFYIYRRRSGSITTDRTSGTDFVQYAEVVRYLLFFFENHSFSLRLARAWARRYLSFFFDIYFARYYPVGASGFSAAEWTACLRRILEKGGRGAYLKLTRYAGLPKKLAAPLVLLCGIHPILDWPARVYFRFLYYPLVLRSFRRRMAKTARNAKGDGK